MDLEPLNLLLIICTVPAAIFGFVKSPLWTWIVTPILKHRMTQREWRQKVEILGMWADGMEERMESLEIAIAPTNGDKRSISDRLDTVKYRTGVMNNNVMALADFLVKLNPDHEPPVFVPLPDR